MTHIQLIKKFERVLKKSLDTYFFYKIPDTKGLGGLRPFDAILLYHGFFYAIEFKVEKDTLKKHQTYYLQEVRKCAGMPMIITEKTDLKRLVSVINGTFIPDLNKKITGSQYKSPRKITNAIGGESMHRGSRLTGRK